jgi:hypothetical protein
MRPDAMDLVVRRRRAAMEATRTAMDCRVIIMTLGLVEVWFDRKTETYLNVAPRPQLVRREADRFEMHVLSFEETFGFLNDAIELLRRHARTEKQIILTVSPVPLAATNRPTDVILANTYSKSMLRVATESACEKYPFVTYFPSYESIVHADRKIAFGDDMRHVTSEMVELNVGRMVRAFVGDERLDMTRISDEIRSGGAPVAIERARSIIDAGSDQATEFFDKFGELSQTSLDFALLNAQYLMDNDAEKAVQLLRVHETSNSDNLGLVSSLIDGLLRIGKLEEAVAMIDTLAAKGGRTGNMWIKILSAAILAGERELVLRVVTINSKNSPTHAGSAYLLAAKFLEMNGENDRAIVFYLEVWRLKDSVGAALKAAELLLQIGRMEEARDVLAPLVPQSERDKRSHDRLRLLVA